MTKDKALKLALDALERYQVKRQDFDTFEEAITSIKEALAPTSTQCEVQPEQEVDWKDQYEKQKRRAEMWIAKYEEVAGPLPYAVPLAQPEQEASITKTGCGVLTLHSGFDDLPDGTKFYTTPPKRPWVGLTEDEASWCQAPSTIQTWKRIEAKLKEKNTWL